MALTISDLRRVRATDPPRVLIYGPPGMGKTTLASEWPNPVFIQVEDGTPGDVELTTFGKIQSYGEVQDAIQTLYDNEHDRQTLVIDSLDKLEPMVWARLCEVEHWASIEEPGYGKGYVLADSYWRDLINATNLLRDEKGMNIVYVAHSAINTIDDPMTQSYSRFDIKLHKRAVGLFQDEVDAIFFLNQDVTIKEDKQRSNKGARSRADGGGNRWLYTAPRPSFVAKNRYGLPAKILYDRGAGFTVLSSHFPKPQPRQEVREEPEPAAETTNEKPAAKPPKLKQAKG